MKKCKICLSNKPARFKTANICICQGCIKILSCKTENYDSVESHVIALAKDHVSPEPSKPTFDISIAMCRNEAEAILYKNEGIISSILTSIFNSADKNYKINSLANKIYQKHQEEHSGELAKYNLKLAEYKENYSEKVQQIYLDLLNGTFDKQCAETIFKRGYRYRTMTVNKDVLTGRDKEIIKILRGYKYSMVSDTKCRRFSVSKTTEEKIEIFKRDNYKCIICEAAETQARTPFHLHHIIALSNYGTNHHNNFATLCYKCHNKQHDFQITKPKKHTQKSRTSFAFSSDFVAIDIETTGLKHTEHEIIEIAAVRFRNGIHTDVFSSFVKPKVHIPEHITSLTGIKNNDVVNAPDIATVLQQLKAFICNDTLVAHNATFDTKFLNYYFAESGDTIFNEVHCTLKLSRKAFTGLENYKLNTVARYLDIKTRQSHRAYEDALCAGYIYLNCICKATNTKHEVSKTKTQLPPLKSANPVVFDILDFDEFENYISTSADVLYMLFTDSDSAYNVNMEEAEILCYGIPFLKYCKQKKYSPEAVEVLKNKLFTLVSNIDEDLIPRLTNDVKLLSVQFGKSDYDLITTICADLVFGFSRDNNCDIKIKNFIVESIFEGNP